MIWPWEEKEDAGPWKEEGTDIVKGRRSKRGTKDWYERWDKDKEKKDKYKRKDKKIGTK